MRVGYARPYLSAVDRPPAKRYLQQIAGMTSPLIDVLDMWPHPPHVVNEFLPRGRGRKAILDVSQEKRRNRSRNAQE